MAFLVGMLLLFTLWWAVVRTDGTPQAAGPALGASPSSSTGVTRPASPRPTRRTALRREGGECPLTVDDVIDFGLALERSEDVVRSAVRDPVRGPAEPCLRRDVRGPQ